MGKTASISHVRIAKSQCPICLETHSHNVPVLIHKELKDIKEDETWCAPSLCKEHDEMSKDYLGIVIISNDAPKEPNAVIKEEQANRTGKYVMMRRDAANELFDEDLSKLEFIFGDLELLNVLKALMPTKH